MYRKVSLYIQAAPSIHDMDHLATDFRSFVHSDQNLTWISRLFSDGDFLGGRGLGWSFNLGLGKQCGKDWLVVLL